MKIKALYPFCKYNCYIIKHSVDGRKLVSLVHKISKKQTTISFARFLISVKEKRIIPSCFDIHHINGNQLEDRIFNLKVVSDAEHQRLYHSGQLHIRIVCPICKQETIKAKRNTHFITKTKPPTTCGYSCGYQIAKLSKELKEELKKNQKILQEFYL